MARWDNHVRLTPAERNAHYRTHHPEKDLICQMRKNAKVRAKAKGIPFTITTKDIVIPDVCPVLGVTLTRPDGTSRGPGDYSPSLDRIVPELGYVPGNIRVISYRANRIRNDATIEELEAVLRYAKGL